ncbi:MAG: hypothetical protein IJZ09_02175 [Tidjanibacter sp.]|nr:hypothetical protein [Tidjanibacter sp.]
MGMSSPTTKAEAREQIAKLQGDIAKLRAQAVAQRSLFPKTAACHRQVAHEIAEKQAKIAELRAKIPSLP